MSPARCPAPAGHVGGVALARGQAAGVHVRRQERVGVDKARRRR